MQHRIGNVSSRARWVALTTVFVSCSVVALVAACNQTMGLNDPVLICCLLYTSDAADE